MPTPCARPAAPQPICPSPAQAAVGLLPHPLLSMGWETPSPKSCCPQLGLEQLLQRAAGMWRMCLGMGHWAWTGHQFLLPALPACLHPCGFWHAGQAGCLPAFPFLSGYGPALSTGHFVSFGSLAWETFCFRAGFQALISPRHVRPPSGERPRREGAGELWGAPGQEPAPWFRVWPRVIYECEDLKRGGGQQRRLGVLTALWDLSPEAAGAQKGSTALITPVGCEFGSKKGAACKLQVLLKSDTFLPRS